MCKEKKTLLEFWFRKDQNDYRANCKKCCSNKRKKYYNKNRKILLDYAKEYRKKYRDRILKLQKKYYYKNDGAKMRRLWRNKNLLKERKTAKKYRLNNPEKFKNYYKKRWQKILNNPKLHQEINEKKKIKNLKPENKLKQKKAFQKHFRKNREYYKIKNKKHYNNNKIYYHLKTLNRKKYIIQRTPKWANLEKIKEFYKNRKKGYHVDHIIPLQGENVCGFHVENNLQYLTAKQNIAKGNKYFE